tara:strand:- start:402 stop:515 length:114 start_codon:yes stop_codon:yes gene_type:complete
MLIDIVELSDDASTIPGFGGISDGSIWFRLIHVSTAG